MDAHPQTGLLSLPKPKPSAESGLAFHASSTGMHDDVAMLLPSAQGF